MPLPNRTEAARLALFAYALAVASAASLFIPIVRYGAIAGEAAAITSLLVAVYAFALPRPNPWLFSASVTGIALTLAALVGIAAETADFYKLERQGALTEAIVDTHRAVLLKYALLHLGGAVGSAVTLGRFWRLQAQSAVLLFIVLWLSFALLEGWMQLLDLFLPLMNTLTVLTLWPLLVAAVAVGSHKVTDRNRGYVAAFALAAAVAPPAGAGAFLVFTLFHGFLPKTKTAPKRSVNALERLEELSQTLHRFREEERAIDERIAALDPNAADARSELEHLQERQMQLRAKKIEAETALERFKKLHLPRT